MWTVLVFQCLNKLESVAGERSLLHADRLALLLWIKPQLDGLLLVLLPLSLLQFLQLVNTQAIN
jgi:hypothetical protein